ncbi:hypothetical protein SAMN05444359_101376 [Neolewinella agarilytica]|uniref:Uncharacterized protein n=1 Tax=Neolewinella agarilytica TaxID=478744 RepID=A0A1H8ZMI6_9BACT|nr:hypothetical protein SAMN05444359_101376 [Neolewinella agarilytica]
MEEIYGWNFALIVWQSSKQDFSPILLLIK